MAGARVAFATCRELPDTDPDDEPAVAPLAARGISVTPVPWDEPGVDWAGFDLVVVRSTWNYSDRYEEFLTWTRQVPRLANPADVIAWNTDKRYLAALADAGAAVVPTTWLPPTERWHAPDGGRWVVKPAVSAGSRDTGRYDMADPGERDLAAALVARLHQAGRTVMIQPYLSAVDTYGETALLFFGGEFSHAVRKGPMLAGPYRPVSGLFVPERLEARVPSAAEREVAGKVLAVSGVSDRLLYARVDLIPGPDGPVLLELELAEPSLFLRYAPRSGERFARAIARAIAAANAARPRTG